MLVGVTLRMRVGESGLDTVKKEEGMNWGGVWSGPGCSNWIEGSSALQRDLRRPCSLLVGVCGSGGGGWGGSEEVVLEG